MKNGLHTLQTHQEASQPFPEKPHDVKTAATCKKIMSSLQDFFGVVVLLLCNIMV
jgi:hypothetical protein